VKTVFSEQIMRASVVLPHWRGPEDGHARMRAEQVENVGNRLRAVDRLAFFHLK
jgi:hypothetical protein